VLPQRFMQTSEWLHENIFSAYCPKMVPSTTEAAFLHTSNSMFDVLERPQPLSILR
jgi:hypothetical protein